VTLRPARQLRLIRERAEAAVCLIMLLLLDAAWFVSAFGKEADGNVALSDETTVVTVAVSLHWFPVASMPPFGPRSFANPSIGSAIRSMPYRGTIASRGYVTEP
jgi:hypothetical protein